MKYLMWFMIAYGSVVINQLSSLTNTQHKVTEMCTKNNNHKCT